MAAAVEEQEISLTDAVRAEQIRTLYRQSVGIIIVNPLNAAIVAAVLWPSNHPVLLAGWVAAMVAVTAARGVLRSRYLRVLALANQTEVWARRFVIGAAASGILWGLGAALFYEPQSVSQLLIIFVIGGMVAGASGTSAHHLPAFLGFTASAVVPASRPKSSTAAVPV
jgi:hypothetical protein